MLEDPRLGGLRPPFPAPRAPGDLEPKPDHGERTYVGSSRLKDRTAIVVGGDSGIGRAVAIAFAREGANVLVGYRSDHKGAGETARWVIEGGRRAALFPGDLTREDYRHSLVDQAIKLFGSLDVLVSDAPSIDDLGSAEDDDRSATSIEEAIRTDQESVFALSLLAADKMKPGAAVIATTLARSEHSPALQRAYAAYRGGIATLTASLALKLAARGVRVNAVEPGPVWAPRMLAALTDRQLANFGAGTLFGRPAQPAELAPVYVFLASREASFITGAVLPVTGGQLEPMAANAPKFAEETSNDLR
jgi:NAD(P)-dependent dehydrogenase (short-subunit alcohol dehydrogenase family)